MAQVVVVGELAGQPHGQAGEGETDEGEHPEGHDLAPEVRLAALAPDPAPVEHVGGHGGDDVGQDVGRHGRHTELPNKISSTTCDTMVEITDTEAYLTSLMLDGWAMIWRSRADNGWSDDQICPRGGCPP